ncbi:MAG TPA: PAS domain S-box protein [Thermoanaerobaculia bacterium]|nr:PAS domain S-box protein [Thermoanaerobaculia bacterium]
MKVDGQGIPGPTGSDEEGAPTYRDLVENSLGLICTHAMDGRLLSINPAGAELLGYLPAEVVGRNLRDILAPAVRDSLDEYLRRLFERTSDSGFMRVQTRQGEERILYYRNRVCQPPGRDPYVLGHAQDLTDLKRAERALRQAEKELLASHARQAATVEAALDGILSFDAEGHILELNPAALTLLGRSREEAAGLRLTDVAELPGFVPSFVPSNNGGLAAYLRQGLVVGRRVEVRGRRADGSGFPLELAITRLPGDGPAAFTAFLRDLTDLHEVERLKSQFVATVSHELRTPLTSLRGALGLLAGGVLGPLPQEAFNAVHIAERSIRRLVGLVNDILDIERLEHGALSLQLGRHSLADLLTRSVEEVEALALDAGIRLEAEPTAAEVLGDGERLVQVIVNLLSNALKFSPRGSRVHLRVRVDGAWVEIQVEDQGRGVPPSHRTAIFDRFRQVEPSDAAGQRGAGLGLAIAKSIVELHGGTMGVESREGEGSLFWFRLPQELTADPAM